MSGVFRLRQLRNAFGGESQCHHCASVSIFSIFFCCFSEKPPANFNRFSLGNIWKILRMRASVSFSQRFSCLGPDNAHIGKVLSALAEVYKQENLCEKETDALILKIFQMLPRENLFKLAGGFSEKQQKKIEKMLTEAQ